MSVLLGSLGALLLGAGPASAQNSSARPARARASSVYAVPTVLPAAAAAWSIQPNAPKFSASLAAVSAPALLPAAQSLPGASMLPLSRQAAGALPAAVQAPAGAGARISVDEAPSVVPMQGRAVAVQQLPAGAAARDARYEGARPEETREGLQSVSARVGDALAPSGAGRVVAAEGSRSAADGAFAALSGEELIRSGQAGAGGGLAYGDGARQAARLAAWRLAYPGAAPVETEKPSAVESVRAPVSEATGGLGATIAGLWAKATRALGFGERASGPVGLAEARREVSPLFQDADLTRFRGESVEEQLAGLRRAAEDLPGLSVVYLEAPTAAGKSTLANNLRSVLGSRIKVFPVDRYFKETADMPRDEQGRPDFDRPDSLLLDRAASDIRSLLAGRKVEIPAHDMASGSTRFDSGEYLALGPDDVLVVDSIYASHESLLRAAEGHRTLNVFLYAPASVRLARRLKRDRLERGMSISRNLEGWPGILANEARHILPLSRGADMRLNLVTEEELRGLPDAYADILAREWAAGGRDEELSAALSERIGASLRADAASAREFLPSRKATPSSVAGFFETVFSSLRDWARGGGEAAPLPAPAF